jgi:plasmid stabilization system protein ParE
VKTYEVKITRQARDHLREIKSYIADELLAPEAAANTIVRLKKEIKGLSTMPGGIKLTDEEPWRSEGIQKLNKKVGRL